MPRFVIHEHYARSHHFDLRSLDGVPVSWAVPRSMPDDPNKNRLAIRAEDHAPSHLTYKDDTLVGADAVKVSIWDSGSYEPHEWSDDEVVVSFDGKRIAAKSAIFRAGGENRPFHRMERS